MGISFEKKIHGINYAKQSFSFDIETSSFYDEFGEKTGIMYVWQFAISNKMVIIGRTWDEFKTFMSWLKQSLRLGQWKKIFIYIHNAAFEFQWMRQYFDISCMLATAERKPIRWTADDCFIFRCSYFLTNSSLEHLANNFDLPHKKAVGNLDYSLIRHSQTPLTDDELIYIINDVLVINEYIEMIEIPQWKSIYHIPNTATGKTRIFCRKNCIKWFSEGGAGDNNARRYREFIHNLNIQSEDEFRTANDGYIGGFNHGNHFYVDIQLSNVRGKDICSSYPTEMVLSDHMPVGPGKLLEDVSLEEYYEKYEYKYCCMMEVTMLCVTEKFKFEHILSDSKCYDKLNVQSENGRIYEADKLTTVCTDIDFRMYRQFYNIGAVSIKRMYIYKAGYLPKSLIRSVLQLYSDKTALKGVSGAEIEYQNKKAMLNSVYGCCVTNPFKNEWKYDNQWFEDKIPFDDKMKKYNEDNNRFLFYLWGCFITSSARESVFQAILHLGADYIYSDTDSVKYLNPDKHEDFFRMYNLIIDSKIEKSSRITGIPIEMYRPKTIKGVEKPIGYFETDAEYEYFKTLGAKRYMVKENGEYHITVAGLSKSAVSYIEQLNPENPLAVFNDDLIVPANETHKLCHAYIDEIKEGEVTDYLGQQYHYHELSSIHLEPVSYDMSIPSEYIDYIIGAREEYVNI